MKQVKKLREMFVREERARKRIFTPHLLSIGLTPGQGQARILSLLLEEDALMQKELADRCHMDTTTLSRNIDKLENLGLVLRKPNPDSRRSYLICLTEIGKIKAADIEQMFESFEVILTEGIAEEELKNFRTTLEKICSNLERSQQDER